MENRVLGKGLSALIQGSVSLKEKNSSTGIAFLQTGKIRDNANQPRKNYDPERLEELKNSIKEKGVLQPILVREVDGNYEVIAGERRLKAARELALEEVPAIIKEVSNEEALVLALVENIQREELNPIEEAKAFEQLINEFRLTQEEVAQAVGKDRSTVSNVLRLLKLPALMQKSVSEGNISMGHARALLGIADFAQQRLLFEQILHKGWSVRELEVAVRGKVEKPARRKAGRTQQQNPELVLLEEDLQKVLGTRVRIVSKKKRGKIIIEYYSLDDLERVLQIIKK